MAHSWTERFGSSRFIVPPTPGLAGSSASLGQTVATTGSSTNPYMFAATSGYRNDGDAGLMHVRARYYDAQVGRFIARDPYLGQKPYLYCEHNPVNWVDPTGHCAIGDGLIRIGCGLITAGGGIWGLGFLFPPLKVALDPIGGLTCGVGFVVAAGGVVANLICWIGALLEVVIDRNSGGGQGGVGEGPVVVPRPPTYALEPPQPGTVYDGGPYMGGGAPLPHF